MSKVRPVLKHHKKCTGWQCHARCRVFNAASHAWGDSMVDAMFPDGVVYDPTLHEESK